jgi:V8-like Glu-specific endopeptidase
VFADFAIIRAFGSDTRNVLEDEKMSDAYELVEPPAPTTTMSEMVSGTRKYWTPANLKDAVPVSMPTVTRRRGDPVGIISASTSSTATGNMPLVVAPVLPTNRSTMASVTGDTKRVDDITIYPYSVVGKLFMAFPGGNSVGSAWVIGKRAIFTAGHCLFGRREGGWANNVQFVPQFANNSQTIGTWTVTKMTALKEFVDNDNLEFDMACGILDRDIGDLTGIAGYSLNIDTRALGEIIGAGYPARAQDGFPFNGADMWRSIGKLASDAAAGSTKERNYGAFNDMSGGCSGGPWFTKDAPGMAIGLNSHIMSDTSGNPVDVPRQMRSPYFGGAFLRLLKWMEDNGGKPNTPGGQPIGVGMPPPPPPIVDPSVDVKGELLKIANALTDLAKKL